MTAGKGRDLLLDTHIWIWCLTGSPRLSPAISNAIGDESSTCWLSPISVWEFGVLVRKRKLEIDSDVRSWVDRALKNLPLREASLSRDVAILAAELDLPHHDPADRLLAATAVVSGLELVTVDRSLVAAPGLPIFDPG